MYSKLYCIIWYFACLHKYPKWIVLSSYAMISIELCILCSIGNRFGSVRLVLGGCQWPALGRNLHNFIWIVALINCPRFPLSSILSLSVSVLLFYRLHIVMTFKTFVLFLYVPVFLPPLLLYRSPSLLLLVPMLSPAFDFSLIKLSASGYGFLSHYGSVLPPFFSTFFFLSLLNVFLRFASSTALWFGSHSASFIDHTMAKRKYLRIFWRALLSVAPPLSWHRQPTERTKTTCA